MQRRSVLQVLAAATRAAGAFTVVTMQAVPVWHEVNPGEKLHVDMLGCMGSASSFGLGLALGAPELPVVVIDGDGSLMMQLATLVTIGDLHPANFTLAVMGNKRYETSGNQFIPGAQSADLPAIALGAGFATARSVDDLTTLEREVPRLIAGPGPALVLIDVDREEPRADWPPLSMKAQLAAVRTAFTIGEQRR
jgi:sulfopyruvate decarboxylase subunit beta